MKKIIFLFVCIFAFCSFAGQKTAAELREEVRQLQVGTNEYNEWWNARTVEDLRVLADDVLLVASTNMVAAYGIGGKVMQYIFCHWAGHPMPGNALAAEYDEKFKNGPYCGCTHYWKLAPKTTLAYLELKRTRDFVAKHPVFCSSVRTACTTGSYPDGFAEVANKIAESAAVENNLYNYRPGLEVMKKRLLQKATKHVRHSLRDRGLPITVSNGVNPVKEAVDELTDALNAPRMSGLKEWVAKWCPDYTWVDVKWMTDAELAKFKEDIFYGDIDFNANRKFILCAHIGPDEYNKFVKAFNCEKE